MTVQMELSRILIREGYESHIVELREINGDRVFPIVIGPHEAVAIERRIMEKTLPRPQTHELLEQVIQQLGATIERIEICDLRDHTFYAQLVLVRQGKEIIVDSRPSDALALGASSSVPLFVAESVLEAVCPPQA